jgi:hypothetical protein
MHPLPQHFCVNCNGPLHGGTCGHLISEMPPFIFILYLTVKVLHEWYLHFTLKLYVWITYLLDFIPLFSTHPLHASPLKVFPLSFENLGEMVNFIA